MIESYGNVSYNGYEFPSLYRLKLSSEVVYNDNNPTRKYYHNTLTVEFVINSPDTITNTNDAESVDAEMGRIRRLLSAPRKELAFTFQGAGFEQSVTIGVGINGDRSDYHGDITGGPRPSIVNWIPLAANKAANVQWVCEFDTSTCISESNTVRDLVAVEYSRIYSLNEEGVSRITTEGTIEVRFISGDTNNNLVHVDNWRDADNNLIFYPPIPRGFRRTQQDYTHDRSGRKIDFILIDEEIPGDNPMFPYTIRVEASHEISSSLAPAGKLRGAGFFTWDNDIEANITIAPGYPRSLADTIFRWILWQRYGIIGDSDKKIDESASQNEATDLTLETGDAPDSGSRPFNILTAYKIKENIYSRDTRFNASYFGTYKLGDLITQTGLFTPVYTTQDNAGLYPWQNGYTPNRANDYGQYEATINPRIQTPTGYRQAKEPYLKVLFDPCDSLVSQNSKYEIPLTDTTPLVDISAEYTSIGEEVNEDQNEDQNGYLKYQNEFHIEESTRNHKIEVQDYDDLTTEYKKTQNNELISDDAIISNGWNIYNKQNYDPQEPRSVMGIGGGSSFILYLVGYGIRYGKPVSIPSITYIAGRPAFRVGKPLISQKVMGEGKNPLYIAKWKIPYGIDRELSADIFNQIEGDVFVFKNTVTNIQEP